MVYILETNLNNEESVAFALAGVYGMSTKTSFKMCRKLGFSKNLKIKHLSDRQVASLLGLMDRSNVKINDDLKQIRSMKIKRLITMKSYRGLRKLKGFPVRGQRTRSNGNTAKKLNFKKF